MELEAIRKTIDDIDREMAALYEKRMDCARKVAENKYARGADIYVPEREEEVAEKNVSRIQNPDYRDVYREFIYFVMKQSRDIQQKYFDSAEKENQHH